MPCYRATDRDGKSFQLHVKFGRRGIAPNHCREPFAWAHGERCMAMADKLCDWRLPRVGYRRRTCDRPLCDAHAHEVGPNRHYCPEHFAEHQRLNPELPLGRGVDNA